MKITTLLLTCLFTINLIQAQQKAITDTGEEIILFDDGKWEYKNGTSLKETEIPINSKRFKKDDNSTFLLKSNNFNVGFWLNPRIWTFKKPTDNFESEYELKMKDEDLYGMVISEKIEIPLESMKSIAFENGKSVAKDLKIVKEEYRTVNGLKVLLLQMNGTTQGIKISYYSYYFSNTNGSVQFVTYTSQNLMNSYIPEIEKLLNGLVELN